MSEPAAIATSADLDVVLTTQLVVAYAGESSPDAPRLGWWDSDVASEFGALDLFQRLYPATWKWAALRALRAIAKAADHAARARRSPDADHIGTLFHFGFVTDERLDDRLDELAARHPNDPAAALPDILSVVDLAGRRRFDRAAFEAWAASPSAATKPTPPEQTAIGRRVAPERDLTHLALAYRAALVPLTIGRDAYPMPYTQLA